MTQSLQFIYAFPLDSVQRATFEKQGLAYPSRAEIKEVMTTWRMWWSKVEEKHAILSYLESLTRRSLTRHLECFVYGAGLNAMSTPFLMPVLNGKGNVRTEQMFVETIIHELLHMYLVTDNDVYWKYVREYYQSETIVCQNHILLYAMLHKIYNDVFEGEPIDFSRDNLPDGYRRAIEIVRERGCDSLIEEYYKIIK